MLRDPLYLKIFDSICPDQYGFVLLRYLSLFFNGLFNQDFAFGSGQKYLSACYLEFDERQGCSACITVYNVSVRVLSPGCRSLRHHHSVNEANGRRQREVTLPCKSQIEIVCFCIFKIQHSNDTI